jgi:hypothetical protein
MWLRRLIAADAVILVVAAAVFAALFPSNVPLSSILGRCPGGTRLSR